MLKPKVSYVVCCVQRSGSRLLCEALRNTGVAGDPQEYLLCFENGRWEDPDGWWARTYGIKTRYDFINRVIELASTPNGVFGTTIMWNYFGYVLRNLRELPDYSSLNTAELVHTVFADPKFIWLTRRDKLRQAISWAKAAQTGIYHIRRGETVTPQQEPQFDFTFISDLVGLVVDGENGWRSFFAECGVQPLEIVYEDFVAAYQDTVRRTLDYLNIPCPKDMARGERKLLRTSDEVNEEWVKRYLEMKGQMTGH